MKKIIFIISLILLINLSGCSHVEDINGPDDYSLATYTDDDILNGIRSTTTIGTLTTRVEKNGHLTASYKASKISGCVVLESFKSNSDTISFKFDFTCESGNALIVIVYNNEIIKKVEPNTEVSFELNNQGNKYKVWLIGESAKVAIKYEIII